MIRLAQSIPAIQAFRGGLRLKGLRVHQHERGVQASNGSNFGKMLDGYRILGGYIPAMLARL